MPGGLRIRRRLSLPVGVQIVWSREGLVVRSFLLPVFSTSPVFGVFAALGEP